MWQEVIQVAVNKVKKRKKKSEKTASVAAGELCPVKTEDVWLGGDSSNSKWLPFYKLGLCNKMRRGVYYQFSRPVKIAFLKPRRGWSLSREEPESVFLTASPGGRGVWDLNRVRVFVWETLCVCHWERHPLRPLMPAGPAVTEPRSIFLHPQTERHVRVCVYWQKTHMWNILYIHTYSLGRMRLEMQFCVCVYAALYSVCAKLRFSARCLILERDTDRWHVHTLCGNNTLVW